MAALWLSAQRLLGRSGRKRTTVLMQVGRVAEMWTGLWRLLPGCAAGLISPLLLCRAGRSEESPGELNTDLEDSVEKPPEEAPRLPAPGPVLGDFARRKTPKVSESGRPPATLQPYRGGGGGGGFVCLWVLFLPLRGPNYRMAGGL